MKRILVASVLSAAVLASSTSNAALNAYLSLTSPKFGAVKGSVIQKGREGKIMVIGVEHEVKNEGGRKQHGALTVTIELDKSAPILNQILASNEALKDFELQFWSPQKAGAATAVGAEVQYYTIKLTGAHISNIKFHMLNNKNPELMRYSEYEEVSFTYETITETWTDGGIQGTDSSVSKS